MPESTSAIILLCLVSLCLLAMTVTMAWTAREFRQTLRRLNVMLPRADRALHDAGRSFHQARQLLVHANRATRRIEGAVRLACDTTLDTVHHVALWKRRLQGFLHEHAGNGAGADSRRHHRRR